MSLFLKDPGAALDYGVDWADALAADTTLVSAGWAIEPAEAGGLVAAGARIEGAQALVRLSGGRAGQVYRATCRAALSDGSADERTLVIRVEER